MERPLKCTCQRETVCLWEPSRFRWGDPSNDQLTSSVIFSPLFRGKRVNTTPTVALAKSQSPKSGRNFRAGFLFLLLLLFLSHFETSWSSSSKDGGGNEFQRLSLFLSFHIRLLFHGNDSFLKIATGARAPGLPLEFKSLSVKILYCCCNFKKSFVNMLRFFTCSQILQCGAVVFRSQSLRAVIEWWSKRQKENASPLFWYRIWDLL